MFPSPYHHCPPYWGFVIKLMVAQDELSQLLKEKVSAGSVGEALYQRNTLKITLTVSVKNKVLLVGIPVWYA